LAATALDDPASAFDYLAALLKEASPNRQIFQPALFSRALLTEGLLTDDQAIALTRLVLDHDSAFDVRLLSAVCERPGRTWPSQVSEWEMYRALDLLRHSLRNYGRVRILLLRFLRVPYASVRSRVAAMTPDLRPNDTWFDSLITDEDPRVRANIVEALEHEDRQTPARKVLVAKAAKDSHHRVRTTALYILALFGDVDAPRRLWECLDEPDPALQKAAAWALGRLASRRMEQRGLVTG
jgi:hypothetical protein